MGINSDDDWFELIDNYSVFDLLLALKGHVSHSEIREYDMFGSLAEYSTTDSEEEVFEMNLLEDFFDSFDDDKIDEKKLTFTKVTNKEKNDFENTAYFFFSELQEVLEEITMLSDEGVYKLKPSYVEKIKTRTEDDVRLFEQMSLYVGFGR